MDISIFTPKFSASGGADLRIAWTVQALSGDHNLSVYSYEKPDLVDLNESYGTELSEDDFTLEVVNFPQTLEDHLGLSLIKYHYLMRRAKGINSDLKMSVWGEMDLGERGVQFITFPGLAEKRVNEFLNRSRIIGEQKWYHETNLLRDFYIRAAESISSYSEDRMMQNVTVVPSNFVKNAVEDIYGIEARVIHPPVKADFGDKPWEDREDGFIAIGRLSEEKRFDDVINIIKKVRDQGPDVHLHIAGSIPDSSYGNKISKLIGAHDWVNFEGWLNREELGELITNHKYGIHRMEMEPSPLVIPEMIKGGCIVFAHDSGGPAEMLNNNQDLVFADNKEAAGKINRVINNPNLESNLRSDLEPVKQRYSVSKYIEEYKGIINEF